MTTATGIITMTSNIESSHDLTGHPSHEQEQRPRAPPPAAVVKQKSEVEILSNISSDNPGRWTPQHLFVYGSLMNPEVMQVMLQLPSPPTYRLAKARGMRLRMWGIYPALIRSNEDDSSQIEVAGRVYVIEHLDHFNRLQEYETNAYTWVSCDVEYEDGTHEQKCRTFVWAGAPDSQELEDGTFDAERYEQHFKARVL